MLEVVVILQRVRDRDRLVETGIIAGLLVFDAALVEQNQQTRHSPHPLGNQCLCSTQRCNLAAPRGLSIARQRVESKDGILRVRDVPGAGCVFTIDFPRQSMTSG